MIVVTDSGLLKSHVHGFVRKDGTAVRAHEDSRTEHNVGEPYRGFRLRVFKREGSKKATKSVFGQMKAGTKKTVTTVFEILDRHDYKLVVNPSTGEKSSDHYRAQAWANPGGIEDAKKAVDKMLAGGETMAKSHVHGHTKKDGTVVKDYERQGSLFRIKHTDSGKIKKLSTQPHQKIVAPQYGMGGGSFLFHTLPKAPPKVYHPKNGDNGKPVGIYNPNHQTAPETWHDQKKTATFIPGGACPDELNGLALSPWLDHPKTDEEWDYVEGQMEDLDEPVMHLKQGLKPASGCIIKEPDGRVWLVSPTNQFGGYKNTFPKGKIEDEMSWQANAIKEVFEESGLKVKIVGYACDVDRTSSVTRYYHAVRVGGTPADVGWESQAAHLVPESDLHLYLDSEADHDVISKAGMK